MRAETRDAGRASLLDRAAARLREAGIESPRHEALVILRDVTDTPPLALLCDPAAAAPAESIVLEAIERRVRGEPLAYVTRRAGFRHLELEVGPAVLIPRPETETIVDLALGLRRTGTVADIGTGSGCIALALRQEGAFRLVLGVDRSLAALALARRNRERAGLDIGLVQSDLTAGLASAALDLLVANPPYVSEAEYAALDPGVRDHEPRMALESGPDGLDATRRLLDDGRRVLRPDGALVLEVASERADRVADAARAGGWSNVQVSRDLFGRPRFLTAHWRAT